MMHDSLRLKILPGLSSSEQIIAKSAVNGSLPGLRILVQIQELEPLKNRFLSVFYHHLDPIKIPSEDAMDVEILPDETVETTTRAFVSLEGLFNTVIPPAETHSDLWQRVWPWIRFLSVHHSRIANAPPEDIIQARFFSVIASLMQELPRICSTPGVGILAGHAWANYFRNPCTILERALRRLTHLLPYESCDLWEFVDGAGGVDALANLVAQLVRYLLDSDDIPAGKAKSIFGVLCFCTQSKSDTWLSALRTHEYLRTVISVLFFVDTLLEDHTAKDFPLYRELYKGAWNACFDVLRMTPGYAHVVEAIDAVFLRFYVSLASKRHMEWANDGLYSLLFLVMKPTTLYYSVLSALKRSLPIVAQGTAAPAFISSAQYPKWQEFSSLVHERLEFKRHFDSGQYSSHRACDNLECGTILTKTNFRRCAGCEYQLYYSKECQIKDWRIGHRTACKWTRPPDVWRADHLDGPAFLTGRDKSFLRAMIAHDYERQKTHIFLTRLVRIRQYGESLLTLFDYRSGRVHIDLLSLPKEDAEQDYFRRTARSNRRMHASLIVMPNLDDGARWSPPIRSSSSAPYDALFVLAHTIPPGTDAVSCLSPAVRRAVTQLIETCVSVEIV
ncbi:hypothetical protein C8R45DRAFT_1080624 [Mycena sanguinolenta]|nr:hypothetical protein C8R45DRAFT_1080624 [Mycena sanguinolenta]